MEIFGTLGNIGALHNGFARFVYHLDRPAAHIAVAISDRLGQVVYRESGTKFATKHAGRNLMLWDGIDNEGRVMPDGIYRITVRASDEQGRPVASAAYSAGRMDSREGAATLVFGNMVVPLGQLLSVREPVNV